MDYSAVLNRNQTKHASAYQYYSLSSKMKDSSQFFQDISRFADHWTCLLHPGMDHFVNQIQIQHKELGLPVHSFDEICLEMLVIGIQTLQHGEQAEQAPDWYLSLLHYLFIQKEKFPSSRNILNPIRGWIGGIYFSPPKGKSSLQRKLSSFNKLILWLKVYDLDAQSDRLSGWLPYLNSINILQLDLFFSTCLNMAGRFSLESQKYLDSYTNYNTDQPSPISKFARWRYDSGLVTSSTLEYHLGFLGTEILNRSYRKKFLDSTTKVIILPPCLRYHQDQDCQAKQTSMGAQCSGCHPDCRINQISQKAQTKGLPVFMVPDDSLKKICFSSGSTGKGLGVIGAACALRNWSSGWTADALKLNAQGIILDYAGCRKHWDKKGIRTDINMDHLFSLINNSNQSN